MKNALLITLMFVALSATAQLKRTDTLRTGITTKNNDTVAWVYNGNLNIGINQGFLHNWAAGGEIASATINGLFNGSLTRLYHRQVWSNNLDLTYSLFYAYSNSFIPRKMDDRIDFTSKYGYRLDTAADFYLTALFNFKSQFTKGYDYESQIWDTFSTSNFLSPAYFILGPGIEYRKGTALTLFLSPAAARLTTASLYYTSRSPEGAFGVENGKTTRWELGAYFSGRYTVNITENLTYRTRLDLYSNYLAKEYLDSAGNVVKENNPGNIDILFDNLFTWKMSKYFSVALGATFIYDNDLPYDKFEVDPTTGKEVLKDEPGTSLGWWQIKQIFTIGFQYKFNN
ncbi:MAG: DUF3078 domain-containing protein [Chitinophagales bacterium]|nr:DUF3078 domain-containing protein [Chitinophagaceae bacterium]MCB9064613.1 DUF3078 domain-containing protein [Chitinophagales bacterium]